ncbi:hypothetical protein LTR36_006015 [Oleoguttula mirabilis]|uniref:Uncharacterized protein n=1 Tax=Oleoguttula mirabilis TaxID=1507867 RepID=A0AAV9JDG8_9PEZI|nr:hypothetical protein LTR36_006015 [Oleoguttula mirabilis]
MPTDRRVPLPKGQRVRAPVFTPGTWSERSQPAMNGTTRTVDLIEQFPAPPEHAGQATQTPQVWSLFPKPSTPTQRRSFSNLMSWRRAQSPTVTSSRLQKRPRSNVLTNLDLRQVEADGRTDQQASGLVDGQKDLHAQHDRALGATVMDGGAEDRHDLSSIRGEGSTRYRHSGTPVYELDAISLRSHDERCEQRAAIEQDAQLDGLRAPPPSRLASSHTGTSRYHSAASNAMTSSPVVAAGLVQQQGGHHSTTDGGARGALVENRPLTGAAGQRGIYVDQTRARFAAAPVVTSAPSASRGGGPRPQPMQPGAQQTYDANAFPITAVTVTSHGALCPHGKPIKRPQPIPSAKAARTTPNSISSFPLQPISNLDGEDTSAAPPSATQPPQTQHAPAILLLNPPTIDQPDDQQPPSGTAITLFPPPQEPQPPPHSTTTPTTRTISPHGTLSPYNTFHPAHLRNVGRAKGTWRTRMSRTKCWRCELHNCRKTGRARLARMMEWTCFCRFRAYDPDSSSEEEEGLGLGLGLGGPVGGRA